MPITSVTLSEGRGPGERSPSRRYARSPGSLAGGQCHTRTVIMSVGSAAWLAGAGWSRGPVRPSRGCGSGPGLLDGVRAVQQRLAAQPGGDAGCFADRGRSGFGLAQAGQVAGVVEQAVGQVVGGAQLAQAADGGGE